MLKKNPARTQEYLSKYYKAKELVLNKRYSLTKASKIVGIDRRSLSNCLREEGYEIVNYQNMINEEDYDPEVLGELNAFDEIYLQPARKNCALLSSKSAVKILDEVGK